MMNNSAGVTSYCSNTWDCIHIFIKLSSILNMLLMAMRMEMGGN